MKLPISLLFLLFLTTSCNGPIKNPHDEDPIFQFYKKQGDELSKDIEREREEITKANTAIDKASAQMGDKRDLVETLFEHKNNLEKLYEKKDYVDQKLREIIKVDLQKYKTAYENKKPWPDPADFEAFKLKKEMETFKNKEWNSEKRVRKYLKGREKKVEVHSEGEGGETPPPSH